MIADLRRFKFSRVCRQLIVMLYARSRFSARRAHKCFKYAVVNGLPPPVTENISGVKEACSPLPILSLYLMGLSC